MITEAAPATDAVMAQLVDTMVETYALGALGTTYFTEDAVVRDGCNLGHLARLAGDFIEARIEARGPVMDVTLVAGGRKVVFRGESS